MLAFCLFLEISKSVNYSGLWDVLKKFNFFALKISNVGMELPLGGLLRISQIEKTNLGLFGACFGTTKK